VGVELAGVRVPSNLCRVSCGFGFVLISRMSPFTGWSFCELGREPKYYLSSAHC
jgi:hypothetical protein